MRSLLLIFTFSVLTLNEISAQECGETKFRIFGGPEFSHLLSADSSTSRGMQLGAGIGGEVSHFVGCNLSLNTGLSYYYSPTDYWVDNDTLVDFAKLRTHTFEIPLGIRFNTNYNSNTTAYYFGLAYTNNLAIASSKVHQTVFIFPTDYQSIEREGTYMLYNPGAKFEIGLQNKFDGKNSITVGLHSRFVYHNFFSGISSDKILTMSIGLQLGYIF
jgi:hypothetical protein